MADEELAVQLVVEGMKKFLSEMKSADTSIDGIGETADKSSNILNGAFATALGIGIVKAAEAAIGAIVKLGKAFIGFTAESLEMATEFQTSLTALQIAASSTGLGFDDLHDAAITVGGDTRLLGVSASGAAEAMTGLYKAGLTSTEIFGDLQGYMAGTTDLGGALRASIDLAASTELDMVQASDLAAVALSTFGAAMTTPEERANFVNAALNNMVQAADASVASVSDLAAAMINVGPTASSLGIPIQDMNNALAILSTRGINGAQAGTALKSMLVNLQRPTPAVTKALDDLNVSMYDASGNFVGLENLVGQLEMAYSDLTPEQRNVNSQIIAGSYGMNALNTLLGEGADGWDAMADATMNAATIQEQAAAYAETYAGKQEAMNGQIETLRIQIGEALLPVMTSFLDQLSYFIDQYGPQVTAAFENIVAAIGPFVQWLGQLLFAGENLDDYFKMMPESMQPIATFIAETLIPTLENIWNWLSANLPPAIQILSDLWTGVLLPALTNIWTFIQENVIPVLQQVQEWLALNLPPAIQTLSDLWTGTLLPAITSVWAFFQDSIMPILKSVAEAAELVLGAALETLAGIWETILLPAIEMVWAHIQDNVMPLLEALGDLVSTVLTVALEVWAGIWEKKLLPAIEKFVGFYTDNLKPALDYLANIILPILQGAIDGVAGAFSTVVGWVETLTGKLKDIKLPDWMTPGSPTPLELGLLGIGDAMHKLSSMELPMLQTSLNIGRVPAMANGGGGNYTNVVNNNNYNLTTNSLTRPSGLALEFSAMEMGSR